MAINFIFLNVINKKWCGPALDIYHGPVDRRMRPNCHLAIKAMHAKKRLEFGSCSSSYLTVCCHGLRAGKTAGYMQYREEI